MLKESCLVVLMFVAISSGMVCWKCRNSQNMRDCKLRGRMDTCSGDQGMCMTEVRKSGGRMTINKGCKQTQACKNMRKQNYMKDGGTTQCNRSGQSTCCCCCANKGCNSNMMCRMNTKQRKPMKKPRQSRPNSPVRKRQKQSTPTRRPFLPKRNRYQRCPPFAKDFPNGYVKCFAPKTRRGMICDFKCTGEGYQLFPKHDQTLVCMPNGKWSHPKPCCGMACGHPKYDVITLIHASSKETYDTMYEVMEIMLKRLSKNPTDIRHSHLEFGSTVTHSLDFEDFVEDVSLGNPGRNITAGGKANLGAAFMEAHSRFSSVNNLENRNNITDVILVATDADSNDEYLEAFKMWKKDNALIRVLSFPKDGVYPSDPNLKVLTEETHHVIKYKKGRTPDLAYFIADDLADHSCVNPCNKKDVDQHENRQ